MCEVGTRPALPAGDRGGGETPPASALSPPALQAGCAAGEKCREMGEQPIFTTRAHVFQIDPTTKKNWVPASKQAVTVSYFYDSTRNSYRIISVDGAKNNDDLKECKLERAEAATFSFPLWELCLGQECLNFLLLLELSSVEARNWGRIARSRKTADVPHALSSVLDFSRYTAPELSWLIAVDGCVLCECALILF